MKECGKCKQFKSFGEFGSNKSNQDGLQCSCRECYNKYANKTYHKNKKLKTFKIECKDCAIVFISEHHSCNRCVDCKKRRITCSCGNKKITRARKCSRCRLRFRCPSQAKTKIEYLILVAKNSGLTHKEIVAVFGVAKSLVSYYCSFKGKSKTLNRVRKSRKENNLKHRCYRFKGASSKNSCRKTNNNRDYKKVLYSRCHHFNKGEKETKKMSFNEKDVIKKFGLNPKCYLTGKALDLKDPSSYHFDHIVPVSKGGDNSIDNLGITDPKVNLCKSNLSVDEFIELCKAVVEYNKNSPPR